MSTALTDCDTILELLAIESIEGPGDQAKALEEHCATCSSCMAAREEYGQVASMLVYGLPHTPAGPELRERLRLRVALTPAGKVSRWRRWPVIAGSGIAAALLVGGAVAFWNAGGNEENYGGVQPANTQDHAQWYQLAAAEAGPGAGGGITIDPHAGSAMLSLKGLPTLGPGQVYEFWFLLHDGTRLPVYRFYPQADGSLVYTLPLPDGAQTLGGVWVTLETEGEWDSGPGPNVLIARFQQ